VSVDSNTLHAFEHALLTRVKVLLADGSAASLDQAMRHVDALRARAETAHHRARLVEILALSALVREAQGHPEAALRDLERSLTLAEPAGFVRTYLDLGPAIAPVLRRAAGPSAVTAYRDRLLGAVSSGEETTRSLPASRATHVRPTIMEVLTDREEQVLACLGRRLSYKEIADELFIAPGTVKRHVTSIYGKLDAGNRRQALARAQALGWGA
jgi:LuxR family maltose regulon positive regulatory protein